MEGSQNEEEVCLYKAWMRLQEEEVKELSQQTLKYSSNQSTTTDTDTETTQLLVKTIEHFEEYIDGRRRLARHDVSAYLAPSWCTTFENSLSWIAGCRPSSYFTLIYALCGSNIESRLSQFLQDDSSGDFPWLSQSQLSSIDSLQRRTIMEEEKLSRQMASLQQDMTDLPLALMARESASTDPPLNRSVRSTIGEIEHQMVSTMEEADQLRLNTVKKLFSILEPAQALEYIIAAKKLRLCVQSWGVERDREHGRDNYDPIP